MANSVDPDELLHSVVSHLGLHCLHRLSVRIHTVNTVGKVSKYSGIYDKPSSLSRAHCLPVHQLILETSLSSQLDLFKFKYRSDMDTVHFQER